jgi:hypothetical protein
MGQTDGKSPDLNHAEITAVTPYTPGGTLEAYLDHLRSLGQTAVMSDTSRYAWTIAERGLLQRIPLEFTDEPDPDEVYRLLSMPGILLVTYLRPPDETRPANAFCYVCQEPDYRVEALERHARADIRYGLRNYIVRLCTFDEIGELGHQAAVDTCLRHGQSAPPREQLRRFAEVHRNRPFYEAWGAWKGSELYAWMSVIRIADYAVLEVVRSRTGAKGSPNNAVLYTATRKYIVYDKCRYVSSGLSTIKPDTNAVTLHAYKKRMGYVPTPVHRVFVPRRLLRPLLETRGGSRLLDLASRLAPKMSKLQQAAGLSRLMSGRETAPLAWADPQAAAGEPEEDAEA